MGSTCVFARSFTGGVLRPAPAGTNVVRAGVVEAAGAAVAFAFGNKRDGALLLAAKAAAAGAGWTLVSRIAILISAITSLARVLIGCWTHR